MRVKIKLFAGLKDVFGGDLEEHFAGDSITVAKLQRRLEQSHPKLVPYLPGLAIAVNEQYILGNDEELHDDDEVALIPPISGGAPAGDDAGDGTPHFRVTADRLNPRALSDLVRRDRSGAVVVFEGVVRDRHEDHEVQRIEYQAYEPMAEAQLRAVADAVRAEFPVHDIAVHHRVGTLEIGEASLVVAVSAEHRAEAFSAALRVVDRVKESVPVWKKEFTPDGAAWQEGRPARPPG